MVSIAKDPAIGLNGAVAAELRAERTAKGITFDTHQTCQPLQSTLLFLFNARRLISLEALAEITSALDISVIEIIERAENRLERELSEPEPEPQQ